jgi:hypothetical protein
MLRAPPWQSGQVRQYGDAQFQWFMEPFAMRTLGAIPSLRSSRSPFIALLWLIVVILAAYKSAQAILSNDLASLIAAAVVVVVATVFVAVMNDWRRGFYLLIAWMLFEDLVRKFLGNNMAVYFAKDVLALILYLSFYKSGVAKQLKNLSIPFRLPLLFFFWFCLLQAFNPASSSIFYGILGLKVNFLYVPLFYVAYVFAESEEDLRRFLSFCCFLIIILAGLGLAQSIIGPTFLNPQTLQDDIRELSTLYRAAPISGLIAYRPTSVFVSSGRFQDFLIVAWVVSLGFGAYLLLRTRRGRALASITIGLVAAASLMSASRGVFMWNMGITLVVIAGFLWGAPWRQREAIRIVRAIQRISLLIGVGTIVLVTIFPEALGSRIAIYSETLMPDSPVSELVKRTQTYPLMQFRYAFEYPRWPYGYGLGTCTLGGQYVTRIMHATPMNIGVESGFGNLILELGILGLVLWMVLASSIVLSTGKIVTELRGTPWFPLAFAICLYAILLFFPMMFVGASAYQDFVLNSFIWLLLGFLYRLRQYPNAFKTAQAQATSGLV